MDINSIVNDILAPTHTRVVAPTPTTTAPVPKPTLSGSSFEDIFGWSPTTVPNHEVRIFKLDEWTEEERQFIPTLSTSYLPNRVAMEQLSFSYQLNMKSLLVGPTGSGKTSLLKHYASVIRQPFLRINGRQDMDSEALLGRIVVEDASMKFEYGELPKAIKAGWFICFDEPWKVPSGVLMTLQSYFERDGELLIEGVGGSLSDKVVKSSPTTRLFLADNVLGTGDGMESYGATMVQDASTINRMEAIIEVPYMTHDEELSVLKNLAPTEDPKQLHLLVKFMGLLRTSYTQGNLSSPISIRNYESILKMVGAGATYQDAIKLNLTKRFPEDERNLVFDHAFTVYGSSL